MKIETILISLLIKQAQNPGKSSNEETFISFPFASLKLECKIVWSEESEYDFSTLVSFLRALCGQMSQSVSQSVSRPREDD